jgi:predicted DNA-binding protein
MPLHPKSAYLSVRVPDKTRIKFHSKAAKHGVHSSEALRELIDAFIEDRVTIQPRVTRNPLEKIHVTRS